MKKSVKKVFSLFLCVTLCLTMFPAAAFAEDGTAEGATVPAEQPESSVVLSVEEPAVSAETEAAVGEAEEALFQFSSEQRSAILSRDNGLWLFPLDKAYYGNITDWNGCRGAKPCLFCGESHESCPDSEHSSLKYGHWGLDISAPKGTAVYAPADGAVWWTDRDWEGLGYTLVLERPAENGRSYYAVFSHLSDICLESGRRVAAGELIALTGSSGAVDEPEHLVFSLFLAQSDLGQRVAADPVAELAAVAEKGWLEDGSSVGIVNNNPAAGSPARPLPEDSAILPLLEKHPGTVRYTFDAAELSGVQSAELPLEETVSQEEPAQTVAAEAPDADTTSTIVASGTCGDNLTWTLDDTGLLTISGSGAMWDYSGNNSPWYAYKDNISSLFIESGLTYIGIYAFYKCTGINDVTIPESVISIGDHAFQTCNALTSITIPDNVTCIGSYAFYDCSSLINISIPGSIISIGSDAFYLCRSLSNVHINDLLAWLNIDFGDYNSNPLSYSGRLYYNNILIDNMIIPDGVTKIKDYTFYRCSNLTSVILPDSIKEIGKYAFYGCGSMSSITLPDSLNGIGSYAFAYCKSLTNVILPNNITSISNDTFRNCTCLTNITIPDSITIIGSEAFFDCSSLTSVTLSSSLNTIGSYAFYRCSSLSSIALPDSLAGIGSYAFGYCNGLTNVILPSKISRIKEGTFTNCNNLTNITIPKSVTLIGRLAFDNCSSLTDVTIPDHATDIGESAFYGCSSLISMTIPDTVTRIGYGAFNNCTRLTNVTIPNSITEIPDYAFCNCSLTYVEIPNSITNIGQGAFENCSRLTSVTLPDNVTSIGARAFSGCAGLRNVTISTGVTIINRYTFSDCSSLTNVSIPASIVTVDNYAFEKCINLTNVSIPISVTTIGNYAFNSCSSLADVYYGGGEAQWNAINIGSYNDPLLNATIHYFSNIGNTGAISLDKLSVICYANQKDSEKTSEDFILCPEVNVTSGQLQEITDEKGQATLDKPDTVVTFTKAGYVSRTISLARLSHNNAVYLQKVSDYPVINALWLGDTDILHEEITLEYASEANFDLSPEVDWGQSSMTTLQLYQEGNTVTLQEGTNSVQLAKYFDITKTIYLVATNADGLTAKKELKLKSSSSSGLDGFSFTLGDSLSFNLPDSAGILAGTKMNLDLYSSVPVEVVNENGKIYVAIGYQWDASEDESRETKVKSVAQSAKSLSELTKTITDETQKYKACRDEMKKIGKGLKSMKGSFGIGGSFTILAFAEGYLDSSGNFVLTDSGGILSFGASASYTKPFLAGPVPMFFEVKLSGDVEAQINLYINQEIKAFTPRMAIEGIVALQGGVGVGAAKVASLSGGLKGKLTQNLNLDNGIDYYKLTASLEWYVKLKILFASWNAGKKITSAVWYEYPEPGTASAQALQESSGGKPDFYDSSRYTMDDLSYLERGSGFMGGGASVLSVDGSSGDGPFVSNAYEGASPQAVSFSDGTRLAVWIGYNDLHSGPDALNLYYSYYDGAWSQPQVVEDDGTTDAVPCLRVFDDTAYLVWQDASGSIPESATLDSTANLMEISGGVFDRESVSFTCAGITGGSGVLNMTPTLCGDGSTVCAVWLRNGANDWFGQNYDNSILTSSFSEGSWSSPATLFAGLGPVVSMAADCTGGSVSVACSIDGDCDLNTSEDMEVYLNGKALTENEYIDNGVCFSGGNLYWYSGGRLLENGNDTMAEDAAIGSDRFQIINENGIKALVYAAEDGLASVLYAAYYDSASSGWGSPIVLYSAGTSISAFSASATADGEISVLLQSQAVTGDFGSEDPYGEVSLVWYNAPMGCNIRLDDVRIDNSAYVAGKDVPLYLSLSNTGELAVKSLLIEILDTDGTVLQKETIAQQLLSGETVELMTVYSVKEVVQGKALTVRVSAVGAEETLNDDNSADIVLGWNDLTVENVRYGVTESGETVIHASIVNRGYELQSGVTVELREGSPSGTLVESMTVNELSAFSLENVSFSLSGTPAALYYVCVEHRESDCNYGNDNSFVEIRAQSGEETATPGDLNGDGQVNTMDLIRLMKYISGVEVDVAPGSADVNGDGKENTMDLIRLMKLVNGEIV